MSVRNVVPHQPAAPAGASTFCLVGRGVGRRTDAHPLDLGVRVLQPGVAEPEHLVEGLVPELQNGICYHQQYQA